VKSITTSFSPQLYALHANPDAIVVVVDVLRATSAICTAMHHGVERMIPVASLEEAFNYKKKGYLVAAERDAVKQDGVDFGNSPFHFMNPELEGKTIAISTTNGTQAIQAAKDAKHIVIGSFLNLNSLATWLEAQEQEVVILCAGWKNRFNLEDSLFAGALANALIKNGAFESSCDSTIAMGHLFQLASHDLYAFLENSSHRKRLKNLNLEKDIRYCLQYSIMDTIPVVENGSIVRLKVHQKLSLNNA
jgi:2-phosphosulfolactate phosphatase